jgi:hypothetical protein
MPARALALSAPRGASNLGRGVALGEHVIILVLPLAGGARELAVFEDQFAGHLTKRVDIMMM